MSCKNNCCGSFDFGFFDWCANLQTNIPAQQTGDYTIEIIKGDCVHSYTFQGTLGENLSFHSCFNLGKNTFQIKQPDGNYLVIQDESGCQYDKFQIHGKSYKSIEKTNTEILIDDCSIL